MKFQSDPHLEKEKQERKEKERQKKKEKEKAKEALINLLKNSQPSAMTLNDAEILHRLLFSSPAGKKLLQQASLLGFKDGSIEVPIFDQQDKNAFFRDFFRVFFIDRLCHAQRGNRVEELEILRSCDRIDSITGFTSCFQISGSRFFGSHYGYGGSLPLLHIALKKNHVEAIHILLSDHCVDVNESNNFGQTALGKACEMGNLELINTLLNHPRIDPNAGDCPPLHIAITADNRELVDILLAKESVDPNCLDTERNTPLSHGKPESRVNLVELK